MNQMTRDKREIERAAKACGVELLETVKAIRDRTYAVEFSQETRLNDIYDLANAVVEKIVQEGLRRASA